MSHDISPSVLLHSNLCPSPWVYRVGVRVSLWKFNHQNMAARKLPAMPISRLSLKRVSASSLWHLKDLFLEPWASILEVWLLWSCHSVRKFKYPTERPTWKGTKGPGLQPQLSSPPTWVKAMKVSHLGNDPSAPASGHLSWYFVEKTWHFPLTPANLKSK